MVQEKIILIGGGGHCKSSIEVIESEGRFAIAGIVDVEEKVGQSIFGYSIIASDDELQRLTKEFKYFLITLGQIKSSLLREKFFTLLKNFKVKLPSIVSPHSQVSKYASVGEGTIVMHNVLINAGAKIGNNCIINSNSVIEHDAIVGNHCHISTSAIINGDCIIKDHSFIGSNATISNGVTIEERNIIGTGGVVLKNTEKKSLYAGNPATLKRPL